MLSSIQSQSMSKPDFNFVRTLPRDIELNNEGQPVIFAPDRCDESDFIDRFSELDTTKHRLATIELEDIGRRTGSVKALSHMAAYYANVGNTNFFNRQCHDFIMTFILNDAMENVTFYHNRGIYPTRSVVLPCASIDNSAPELNDALALPQRHNDEVSGHDQITATDYHKGQSQLFISKIGLSRVVLHDWESVHRIYPSLSADKFRKIIGLKYL